MNSFKIADTISAADFTTIENGLAANANEKGFPPRIPRTLAVLQHNSHGEIEAGLHGETYWGWLCINSVWVYPNLRLAGIGRALMTAAELEAYNRGCSKAFLWTQAVNAPDFYQKLGYKQSIVMPDFPFGHQRIGFVKQLTNGNEN